MSLDSCIVCTHLIANLFSDVILTYSIYRLPKHEAEQIIWTCIPLIFNGSSAFGTGRR